MASLAAPAEAEELFLKKLEYTTPIVKAATWLVRLVLHKIRDVEEVTPWYLGQTDVRPEHPVSELFDQEDRRLCYRLRYFCHIILKYRQGEVPDQPFSDLCRAVRILLRRLRTCKANDETIRLLERRVNDFEDLVMCTNGHILSDAYERQVTFFKDSFFTLFGRVSDEFRQLEAVRRGDASEPATKADLKPISALASACKHGTESANRKADILLAVTGETAKTVKRIDRRGKKDNRRRRFTVEQQEQCFRYWELGRKNAAIKENTTGKVRYEHVFTYYRKELKALGIKDCDDFVAALGARSDRISRTRTGR